MLEKNQQLIKEIETFKSQNFTLKEQISKVQTDLNESNVCKFIKFINKILLLFSSLDVHIRMVVVGIIRNIFFLLVLFVFL